MLKKIIIGILVLVLVLVGGFFYYENKVEQEVEEFAKEANVNIMASTTFAKYSLQTLAMHNNRKDCWMSINGNILDVTKFVDKHPGGDVILEGCGKDATEYFNKVPNHMKDIVQTILNKLKIGELE